MELELGLEVSYNEITALRPERSDGETLMKPKMEWEKHRV